MATTVTPNTIRIRFPEFISTNDSTIQVFIDDAVLFVNETYWGDKYDLGISYLTAHYLKTALNSASGNSSNSGPVSGKSVDGVSISYATRVANSAMESEFTSTVYGLKYLAMIRTLGVVAFNV